MDTLKILLAATVALLVGALAVALNKNSSGKDGDKTELAQIQLEIEKLRMERENLEQQRQLQTLRDATRVPVAPPVAAAPAINDQAAMDKIRELEAANAALEASNAKNERKVDVLDKEAAYMSGAGAAILSGHDKSERRIRQVANAMLMASVKEWHDDELGGFAVVNIVENDKVQVGTVLSVRRNSGILGKIRIESITGEGVVASAATGFPGPKPEAGDDLILDPSE